MRGQASLPEGFGLCLWRPGPRELAGPWQDSALRDDAARPCQISTEFLEEVKKLVLEVTSPNFKFLSAVAIIESIV